MPKILSIQEVAALRREHQQMGTWKAIIEEADRPGEGHILFWLNESMSIEILGRHMSDVPDDADLGRYLVKLQNEILPRLLDTITQLRARHE